MRRNDAEFRLVANRVIAQIFRSGQFAQIYQEWIGNSGLQPSQMLTKEKLYELYSKDQQLITWLKRCTFSDAFIWAMARRSDPPFNPWRDREQLERNWVTANRKRGITKFPGS